MQIKNKALSLHSNQQINMGKVQNGVEYIWDPKSEFIVTGDEFSLIRNLVSAVLRDEAVGRVILAVETDKVIRKIFEKGVEDDTIYPKPKEIINPTPSLVGANGLSLT